MNKLQYQKTEKALNDLTKAFLALPNGQSPSEVANKRLMQSAIIRMRDIMEEDFMVNVPNGDHRRFRGISTLQKAPRGSDRQD